MRLASTQGAFDGTYARQVTGESQGGAPASKQVSEVVPPPAGRSRNMAAIRRVDTAPELALRSALHRQGLRFRKDFRMLLDGIAVRPDIVFTRRRVAVFVDGCFWHCCPEHGRQPSTNGSYWAPKLAANVARDERNTRMLEQAGWFVLRIWEHEMDALALDRVLTAVRASTVHR